MLPSKAVLTRVYWTDHRMVELQAEAIKLRGAMWTEGGGHGMVMTNVCIGLVASWMVTVSKTLQSHALELVME